MNKEIVSKYVGNYLPLVDPNNRPFRLALSCGLPTIYDTSLVSAFARQFSCYTFEDVDAQPTAFGIPNPEFKVSKLNYGEKPNCIPPLSELGCRLIEWWDSYLWRAILTANDQGGIYFNLAKFSSARIALSRNRYWNLQERTHKEKILFFEYSQVFWSDEESNLIWPSYEKKRWPTYTEWEIAFILESTGCDNTKFFSVNSPADLEDLEPLSSDVLLRKYGIRK